MPYLITLSKCVVLRLQRGENLRPTWLNRMRAKVVVPPEYCAQAPPAGVQPGPKVAFPLPGLLQCGNDISSRQLHAPGNSGLLRLSQMLLRFLQSGDRSGERPRAFAARVGQWKV